MSTSDRPLVSFVLLAYNQEHFISEAVAGAFAQTYSPLEIILSDDCSKDRTFEIMQKMAAAYKGPHKVILNRNIKNLGIGGHVNRVNELANGQLRVVAAGDDISLALRTEKLVTKWSEDPENIHLLYSDYIKVSDDGIFLSSEKNVLSLDFVESFIKSDVFVHGAVCAWSRACFDRFGPMFDFIHHEDLVIPFRAAFMGIIAYVPEALVTYRIRSSKMHSLHSIWHLKNKLDLNITENILLFRTMSNTIAQKKHDLLKIGSRLELITILDARAKEYENKLILLTNPSFIRKIRLLIKNGRVDPVLIKLFIKGVIAKWLNLRMEYF